jgi:hypothetical protein
VPVYRYSCPLPTCGYSFTDPPGADAFPGPSITFTSPRPLLSVEALESLVVEHLGTHGVADWVGALTAAQQERDAARALVDGPAAGEALAAALEKRAELHPQQFGDCCCFGDVEDAADWLRRNTSAVLKDPEGGDRAVEVTEARVIAEWGVMAGVSLEDAVDRVRRSHEFSPPIQARAEFRLVRRWPDGTRQPFGRWKPYMVGRALTSNDPEPPVGTVVRDACKRAWVRTPSSGYTYWLQPDDPDGDAESWTKIAGNYGPVTVLKWGTDAD